ncbi:MAG: redox-regulated ATPase YchF [Pseudomonadota bacterium]
MSFSCGIIGLPNVGKSTLFNALTASQGAQVGNFPFCTVEPNTGSVAIQDPRLEALAKVAQSQQIIPSQTTFVDIAGLVQGAAKGQGLGNQFLGHIRNVDAIVHVLRCFAGNARETITHVFESIDPLRDAQVVETELMLADLASVERRLERLAKRARTDEEKVTLAALTKAKEVLDEGHPLRDAALSIDHQNELADLLTSKPVLYLCNMAEEEAKDGNVFSKNVIDTMGAAQTMLISAQIEMEIAQLTQEQERSDYLQALGFESSGLARLAKRGYDLLGLISFFTAGEKETRSWSLLRGSTAKQAAHTIHSDFARGFIRAETVSWQDFVKLGGEAACRQAGKLRSEGREYIVADGDVMHFRFNV